MDVAKLIIYVILTISFSSILVAEILSNAAAWTELLLVATLDVWSIFSLIKEYK